MILLSELSGVGKVYEKILNNTINRIGFFNTKVEQRVDIPLIAFEKTHCSNRIWIDNFRYILTNTDYRYNTFAKYYFVNISKPFYFTFNQIDNHFSINIVDIEKEYKNMYFEHTNFISSENSKELYAFLSILKSQLCS
jgi:hypothetical protein